MSTTKNKENSNEKNGHATKSNKKSAIGKGSNSGWGEPQSKLNENLFTLLSWKKILENQEIKNDQKISQLLLDSQVMNTVKNILSEGEVKYFLSKNFGPDSVILLSILPDTAEKKNFELVKDDIEEIFSKYGKIDEIEINGNSSFVYFASPISYLMAKKALDNYEIEELGIKLSVKFVNRNEMIEEESNHSISNHDPNSLFNALQQENNGAAYCRSKVILLSNQLNPHQQNSNSSSKLTWRYDIQIQNDKEFQVAKKIIGAKGCNMKHIIERTLRGSQYSNSNKRDDLIKLRLRGRGSGFKEGPTKRESEEPLHLCVSAKYIECYSQACQMVEELLRKIYAEYKIFYKNHSGVDYQIKKMESQYGTNGKNEFGEPPLFKAKSETVTGYNHSKTNH